METSPIPRVKSKSFQGNFFAGRNKWEIFPWMCAKIISFDNATNLKHKKEMSAVIIQQVSKCLINTDYWNLKNL